MLGGVREILGSRHASSASRCSATHFQPWVVMVLPPGGFFVWRGWLLLFSILRCRAQ